MLTNLRSVFRLKCTTGKYLIRYRAQKILSVFVSTSSFLRFRYFRSRVKYSRSGVKDIDEPGNDEETIPTVENDDELDDLIDRTLRLPQAGHQVLVIQPVIKWGWMKKTNTTPELQLMESLTLIKTLRDWKVVDELIIKLESFHKQAFFGKGNVENIKEKILSNPKITGVFISVNMLTLPQQLTLQKHFGVPVFDRFTIVIHIFRLHATSKEAKLQIQLAELPYLKTVLGGMNEGLGEKFGGGANLLGADRPMYLKYRQDLFKIREAKLKKEILQLRENRKAMRVTREKHDKPVVAVIGYTNAGKTSLIKILTGKETLEPQDYLFATLDVTSHIGELPSNLQVYYVDTVGFISDIPTYLIESFVTTLEDALLADVIIHIRDISHPDTVAQNENVVETLKKLNLPENKMDNIITVGNKVDLVEDEILNESDKMILISCATGSGISELKSEIEKKVLKLSNKQQLMIRVESGSEEYDWLHEKSTIVDELSDPKDEQYIFLKVIISPHILAKFKAKFITNYYQK